MCSVVDRDATGVGVLDRVMAILDVVETNPMGASELARALGLSIPTAHRLVAAMVKHGLLQRDADARHHLGPRFASSAVTVAAAAVLEELRAKTGETAQLWVRRGEDRLCVVCAESTEELRASLPVGTALPLSAMGSAAKALLADADSPGPRVFESIAERTPGLCSVSAGVRFRGAVIAAVCLAAPVFRVRQEGPAAQYGELVEQVAGQLETALHYR